MKLHKRFCLGLIVLFFFYGCSHTPVYETLYRNPETCNLVVTGDVQRVIQGKVQAQDLVSIDTGRLLFALGGGTIESMEEIGEGILIIGRGYIKSNNPSQHYKVVSSNSSLKTPFFMGIERQAQPAEIIYVEGNQRIEDIYQSLAARFGFFAVAGIGEFQNLTTVALKKAPIYGEKIIAPENQARYFHPVTTLTQTYGIFFGIVQTAYLAKLKKDYSQRMFYANFTNNSITPSLQSHTHLALVDDCIIEPEMEKSQTILSAMASARVNDVRHLLTQSRLKQALIMVYQIDRICEYQALYKEPFHSTVTLLARFRGLSTSQPLITAMW